MEKTLRAALSARAILKYGKEIFTAPGMQKERGSMQHGETSVLAHSVGVTLMSLRMAKRLRLRIDERTLVRGALLHDYFLYDWHEPGHGYLHGVKHPAIALRNAQRDFVLNEKERSVILRHMFPLNPVPPTCREGWLVCMADKACALCETFRIRTVSASLMGAIEQHIKA